MSCQSKVRVGFTGLDIVQLSHTTVNKEVGKSYTIKKIKHC